MNRARTPAAALLGALCAAGGLASCGDRTGVDPVPVAGSDAGPDAGAKPAEGGAADAGADAAMKAPRRTVETRNPLGRAIGANLMVDGDFELCWGGGQDPWSAFADGANGSMQRTSLRIATGGRCKTGIKCARIKAGEALFGYGTSPQHSRIDLSVWARVPEGAACSDALRVYLVACVNAGVGGGAGLPPVSDQPDATGACAFAGSLPPRKDAPCVYIENALDEGEVLVDDVRVVAADGLAPVVALSAPPTAGFAGRLWSVRDILERERVWGTPPRAPSAPRDPP